LACQRLGPALTFAPMKRFLDELAWRGLLIDETPNLRARLAQGGITGYVGFDPTASSLQIGNLVPVMLLAHLQRAGGKPIVLVGGGTGLIGDPSGRSKERPLLDEATISANAERQREQLSQFLEFDDTPAGAIMANNAEWLTRLGLVSFLRDVGKHFTLSYMLQKESVKGRMEDGISYTEFSYMLLQAYDFLHLYRTRGCELQLGGSDQWGNITAGIELIRRIEGGDAHGVCAPLLTTSGGAKFGKSEGGAMWLDPDLTSPYEFYQYWINADDRDVEAYLKIFTFMSADEIARLMESHTGDPGARIPHRSLALDVTSRVHGATVAESAAEASLTMFGTGNPADAKAATWDLLARDLPHGPLPPGFSTDTPVVDLIASSSIVRSKSEARRQIQQGGISLNGTVLRDVDAASGAPLDGGYYWLRRGKKNNFIFQPPV
jgi:tyrosyl-tRNA synthetase